MGDILHQLLHERDALAEAFYLRLLELGLPWELLQVSGALFALALASELGLAFWLGRRREAWDPAANIFCYLFTKGLELSLYGLVVIGAFLLLEPLALLDIPISPWSWLLCFVLTDFNYYWFHRIQHEVRVLWAVHSVHHSSEEYDLSTGIRLFAFGDLLLWAYFAPLVLIGFDPAQVLVCMLAIFAYAAWMHMNFVGKLGPLDRLLSTPSNHRVHHGTNAHYVDKNYGGVLIIWDRLLGTYQAEGESVRYGLTKPVCTRDPVRFTFHEFLAIGRDLRRARHWSERWRILLKGPGWQFDRSPRAGAGAPPAAQHGSAG